MTARDEKKLPRWAQDLIQNLRMEIGRKEDELERTRDAHSVLRKREWFTIQGPPEIEPKRPFYRLWYILGDMPHQACTLDPGDILLVGRMKEDKSK